MKYSWSQSAGKSASLKNWPSAFVGEDLSITLAAGQVSFIIQLHHINDNHFYRSPHFCARVPATEEALNLRSHIVCGRCLTLSPGFGRFLECESIIAYTYPIYLVGERACAQYKTMVWRRWLHARLARAPVRRRSSCCPCGSGFPPFHFRSRPFLRNPPRVAEKFLCCRIHSKSESKSGTPSLKSHGELRYCSRRQKSIALCVTIKKGDNDNPTSSF